MVCVVRHPEAWALSMHAKPWHTTPELQRLPFSGFIRAEWTTVYDWPRYLGGLGRGCIGQPLQQDRDPLTGRTFPNLFALRRAKLASLMTMPFRGCTCLFLRLEDAQADPKAMVARIRAALDPSSGGSGVRPVRKQQGWRFRTAVEDRPAPPAEMPPEDRAFMWSQLDPAQEASLGYRP